MILVVGRWSIGRLVVWMIFTFTALVLLVTLIYLGNFDFKQASAWAWMVLYLALPINSAQYLWKYRHLMRVRFGSISSGWRLYLLTQGTVLGLYGVGMLLLPTFVTSFWPWPIDDFHGRVYSAIFIAPALGSFLLSGGASAAEMRTLGYGLSIFAAGAILTVIRADAVAQVTDWSALGTWLWFAAFVMLLLGNLVMGVTAKGKDVNLVPATR